MLLRANSVPRPLLLGLVFVGGMTTMAIEMAGSRLLAPFFGDSLLVWATLIGLVMVYLTAGNYLGGWLADRYPQPRLLFAMTMVAALFTALLPYVSRPLLRAATVGFAAYRWGLLVSSFLGVMALFVVPMTLLGGVSPFAIRLSVRGLHATGRVAGGIYALSSLGSILGTFVPVFLLIPAIGTRNTFMLFAALLALVSLWGWWRSAAHPHPIMVVPLAIAALWTMTQTNAIRADANVIYETESAYNYIQVQQRGETRFLKLNEGEGNQSVYTPGQTLLYRIFDYFLVAPLFRDVAQPLALERVAVIGLAGGTIAHQFTDVYGAVPMDGVEIDPAIIQVGRDWFDMTMPNLATHAQDGRYFLEQTDARYDLIAIDAYKPPYIPFHLTTVEFFQLVRSRLTEGGVVAVNVARTGTDWTLVEAIASTMERAYEQVYIIDATESYNSLVIGTDGTISIEAVQARAKALEDPVLADVAARAIQRLRPYHAPDGITPLTDDRAPVERIVHQMIWRFARKGE